MEPPTPPPVFTVRVRHPASQQLHSVHLEKNLTAKEVLHKLLRVLELRQYSEDELTLVVGASSTFEGTPVPLTTKLDSVPHLFKPDKDILELHLKPTSIRIVLVHDGAAVETKKILVDYYSRLCDNMILFRHCLPKMIGQEDYAIQFHQGEGAPFINSNQTFQSLGFDINKQVISLVQVREVCKDDWHKFGSVIKRGWIIMGHGSEVDSIEKKPRRYAILVEHFLVYFKKEGDTPIGAIPLDIHWLKKKKDDKGQPFLLIQRLHPKNDSESRTNSHSLSSSRGIVQNKLIGVMANVQQKVNELRGVSKNVWSISSDDPLANEVIDSWYKELSSKCLNTGARRLFGLPLEETLSKKNKRLYQVPPLISKVISYLDQRLETEGLFRLQGSAHLIEHYRDQFELGTEVDLSECLDPHTPATLLKQFLRELPEPLLLFSNYDPIIAITSQKQLPIEVKRDQIFELLKDTLPPLNMSVLLFLLAFLNRVYRMADINKMGLSNLGTVFGPNLLRSPIDDPMLLLKDTAALNEAIQILIQFESTLVSIMSGLNPLAPSVQPSPTVTPAPLEVTATKPNRSFSVAEAIEQASANPLSSSSPHIPYQQSNLSPIPGAPKKRMPGFALPGLGAPPKSSLPESTEPVDPAPQENSESTLGTISPLNPFGNATFQQVELRTTVQANPSESKRNYHRSISANAIDQESVKQMLAANGISNSSNVPQPEKANPRASVMIPKGKNPFANLPPGPSKTPTLGPPVHSATTQGLQRQNPVPKQPLPNQSPVKVGVPQKAISARASVFMQAPLNQGSPKFAQPPRNNQTDDAPELKPPSSTNNIQLQANTDREQHFAPSSRPAALKSSIPAPQSSDPYQRDLEETIIMQQATIESLQQQNKQLQARIAELESKIQSL